MIIGSMYLWVTLNNASDAIGPLTLVRSPLAQQSDSPLAR